MTYNVKGRSRSQSSRPHSFAGDFYIYFQHRQFIELHQITSKEKSSWNFIKYKICDSNEEKIKLNYYVTTKDEDEEKIIIKTFNWILCEVQRKWNIIILTQLQLSS